MLSLISNDFFIGILLSLLLGGLIGAQREIRQQKDRIIDFAGFRTFTFISLLGFILGYMATTVFNNVNFILLGIAGIFVSSIVAYRAATKINPHDVSATTEILAIITFLLGVLISLKYYYISITTAIIITSILFLGSALHKFAKNLKYIEVFATLKFAIISIVILPILPNKNYTPLDLPIIKTIFENQSFISNEVLVQLDVFNFYYIWLMVVFISGIAYVGYILMKTIGSEKGLEITGFLGGLMSSTALTSSFAIESRKLNYLSKPLVIGTVIACSTMFFRIIFEVAVINPALLPTVIILLGIMGLCGYFCGIYLLKKVKLNHVHNVPVKSPFTLIPALKFAFFFVMILLISKIFIIYLGNSGIYLVAFISGIADVDAITISLAGLALNGHITNFTAEAGIFVAAFANTIFKGGIAYYLGSKDFFRGVLAVFSIIITVGLIVLFVI